MLKVELCIILIIMLIDTSAVMQATNAANKDLYTFILPQSYLLNLNLLKLKMLK